MRDRRTKLEIIAKILGSVAHEGAVKTHIIYRANISFAQLQTYLPFLLDVDLIKKVLKEHGVCYEITDRGKRFLESYKIVSDLITKEEKKKRIGVHTQLSRKS